MLKTLQVNNLTCTAPKMKDNLTHVSKEEDLLINYIVETEPCVFAEVVSYWLYTVFTN